MSASERGGLGAHASSLGRVIRVVVVVAVVLLLLWWAHASSLGRVIRVPACSDRWSVGKASGSTAITFVCARYGGYLWINQELIKRLGYGPVVRMCRLGKPLNDDDDDMNIALL